MSGFQAAVEDNATPAPQAPAEGAPVAEKTSPATDPQVATTLEDGSIVVGGRIYRPEAAAKKIEHADKHISTLEEENAKKDEAALQLLQRIEALEKSRNTEDALDKLVNKVATAPVAPPVPEPSPTQEISKDELIQATLDTIEGKRVAEQQEANKADCIAAAQAAYGDAYGMEVDKLGLKYGISVDQVVEMASNQPKVFKTLFLPEGASSKAPDTTGSTLTGMPSGGTVIKSAPRKMFTHMNAKERSAELTRRMEQLNIGN